MNKIKYLLSVTAVLICYALTAPAAAQSVKAVSVKPETTVTAEMIRLSDVFTGIDSSLDQDIATAPKPGQKVTFNGDVLTLLAKRFNLLWMPVKSQPRAVVYSASNVVSTVEIENALIQKFALKGFGDNLDVDLDGRKPEIHLELNQEASLNIRNLSYDTNSKRFVATLVAPADDPRAKEYAVTGRAFQVVEVPVVNRRVESGQIIRSRDIDYMQMRLQEIGRNVITEESQLLGKTPRRALAQGQMVREDAVQEPVIVAKGKSVVVTFVTDNMSLSVRGRAVEDGAMGELIRVMNTQSNKTFDAEVIGSGKVRVFGAPKLAAIFGGERGRF